MAFTTVLFLALLIAGYFLIPKLFKSSGPTDNSIAVLPFRLLSEESDKQYLADGWMNTIVLHLSNISDLRVIPRISVEQYRNTSKTAKEIAQELNVKFILYGSILISEDSLRLGLQLINTMEERSNVWNHEIGENLKNTFSVQSKVALDVAEKIEVAVSPGEKKIIELVPTTDLSAYDFYLRGNEYYFRSYGEADIQDAIGEYWRAINIDSSYALAWVRLAGCYRFLFWLGHDRSEQNVSLSKTYLDKALSISPNLKEVRIENAIYYYHCKPDYKKSLKLLGKLISDYPLDAEIHAWTGYVYRRKGEPRKTLEHLDNAINLNPSHWAHWYGVALLLTEYHLPESKDAESYYYKTIALNPSYSTIYAVFFNYYIRHGQLTKAKEFLQTYEDKFDSNLAKLNNALLDLYARNYNEAIQFTQSLPEGVISKKFGFNHSKHHYLALIYRAMHDDIKAAEHFNLEKDFQEKNLKDSKYDFNLYAALGYAYAGLGKKELALESIRKYQEIYCDFFHDANTAHFIKYPKCEILVMLREYDLALEELDKFMKQFGYSYIGYLKFDPIWDPVRNHEKFNEIIANYDYQFNLRDD